MLILLLIALMAIIVLSIIVYILYKSLKYILKKEKYTFNLNNGEDLHEAFELLSKDKITCEKLIIFMAYNENLEDNVIYDFSLYEEKSIVNLTYYLKKDLYRTLQEEFEEENDEMLVSIFENQTIYQLKDGGYQWDISSLL